MPFVRPVVGRWGNRKSEQSETQDELMAAHALQDLFSQVYVM
jgi:hypothetical protein